MINWEVHTLLCSSQFAASPFVTILDCFVSFPLSYFVSAYLSSDTIENATLTGKLSRGDSVTPLAKQVEDIYKVHEAEMERTKALQQRYEDAIKQSNEIVDFVENILANNGVDVSNS